MYHTPGSWLFVADGTAITCDIVQRRVAAAVVPSYNWAVCPSEPRSWQTTTDAICHAGYSCVVEHLRDRSASVGIHEGRLDSVRELGRAEIHCFRLCKRFDHWHNFLHNFHTVSAATQAMFIPVAESYIRHVFLARKNPGCIFLFCNLSPLSEAAFHNSLDPS